MLIVLIFRGIRMKLFKIALPLVASVVLFACGGGPDPTPTPAPTPAPTQQGYFVDSGVQGLSYSASPSGLSGITLAGGVFDYKDGDTVTFSLGGIEFGSVAGLDSGSGTAVVTPLTLAGTTNINDVQANNISRLLITLDSDGDPENGITISEDVRAAAEELSDEAADIDFESDDFAADAQDLVNSVDLTDPANLVTEQEAKDHLEHSLTDTDDDGEIDIVDTDDDGDGILDDADNCVLVANADQLDTDSDESGDACDTDDDDDEILDAADNCPLVSNADQLDTDSDQSGNACDDDDDDDGVADASDAFPLNPDESADDDGDDIGNNADTDDDNDEIHDDADNCPLVSNADQLDTDSDQSGDVCDTDDDGDDILDGADNCPLVSNADQLDTDSDQSGDVCDTDDDGDDILDGADNCPLVLNADQLDTDSDQSGDVCDTDDDGDDILDGADNCPIVSNADQLDTDSDQSGDVCDTDDDGDDILDGADNCPLVSNADQLDTDSDQSGNVCDTDDDGDEILDAADNCPLISNADQLDTDEDQIGDACDDDEIEDPVVTLVGEISNGIINPSQDQTVEAGEQVVFTVMPDNGYRLEIAGCGGELSGDTFTTAAVSEDCSISVSFTPWMIGERYQVFGNGSIIRDVVKGLEWARCAEGTSWDSAEETCIGTVLTKNYTASYGAASDFQGPSGFRLPTVDELNSLVYCSSGQPTEYDKASGSPCSGVYQNPTINAEAFPGVEPRPGYVLKFWSSTTNAGDESYQYVVDFSNGAIDSLSAIGVSGYIRLVRRVDEITGDGLGFPSGFPVLLDKGGFGKGTFLTGRGGDLDKAREQQRQIVADSGLRPVIYIHGNTGHAYKEYQDMKPFQSYLDNAGYQSSHIWAVSYLGMGSTSWQRGEHVYATNIEDVRQFIDAVMEYLDVDKVDLIGHSLGTGMIRGYINGWTAEATFNAQLDRSQSVGTVVLLAGINRGVGTWVNSVYGVNDADAQNGSTFETGNADREAVNGVNYYCAYSSYDKYEYHYKDQFWIDTDSGTYGEDPGDLFHSIADFINDKSPAPPIANPNYISGTTTGYTGDLDAAIGSKNFGYTGFDFDSEIYGYPLSFWYGYSYFPSMVHSSLVNNEAVIEWFGPYLNQ